MKILIVTGMSGAGKTQAMNILEDMNYYCVDNMPAPMLPILAEFCMGMTGSYEKVAIVTDIRDKEGADAISNALNKLHELGCEYEILYLEADLPTIVKRYKESRRPHPLQAEAGSLEAAVRLESKRLDRLRMNADYVLDTSRLTFATLQKKLYKLFVGDESERTLSVTVLSFGFKYGIPIEADMVLDVRFLPNPYYVEDLRDKTGLDREVYDFVMRHETSAQFLGHLKELIAFLLPQYIEEGKRSFTIAVGCTGGRHRSVAVASALADTVRELGQTAEVIHRDVDK